MEGKRPFQLQHFLALALFIVGGVIFYFLGREEQRFLYSFGILFLVVHFIAVIADVVSGKVKSLPLFFRLYLAYTLQTVVRLLALVMYLPMILFDLLSGALALMGMIVALGGLTIYLVEEVMGYDIRGYSFGEDIQISYVIGILVISVVVFGLRVLLEGYNPHDKVLDLILYGLDPLIDFSKDLEDKS